MTVLSESPLGLYDRRDHPWHEGLLLSTLALAALYQDDLSQARAHGEEALAVFQQMEHSLGMALALSTLGLVANRQGDHERASDLSQESLRLRQGPIQEAGAPTEPQLRIFGLDSARVYLGEHLVTSSEWTRAKPKELLFYLLLHPGQTKEEIALALWPDASPDQLRSNLHSALYHLRHALGRPDWVVVHDQRYSFNRSLSYWFDVEVFDKTLAHVQQCSTERPDTTRLVLEHVLQLYQGDLLEDVVAASTWILLRREELREKYLAALLHLAELLFQDACYVEAEQAYHKAIAHDGYSEQAYRGLMRCYSQQGEPGKAIAHYHALRRLLKREMRIQPDAETVTLYERLQRGEKI